MGLAALSQERLVLVGGGPGRSKAALQQFSDWANQENGNILIITWATRIPDEVAIDLINDFDGLFRGQFLISMKAPQTATEQFEFLQMLRQAHGVFFSGGNQNRIMEAFQVPGGNSIRNALVEAYQNGIVFGGTSAGTAVMSRNMIMGNMQDSGLVPLDFGLGFLPSHVIVDQHFSQQKREKRLLRAHTQARTTIAIGIDEDTTAIITNGFEIRVEGDHSVHIYQGIESARTVKTLKAGDLWTIPSQ